MDATEKRRKGQQTRAGKRVDGVSNQEKGGTFLSPKVDANAKGQKRHKTKGAGSKRPMKKAYSEEGGDVIREKVIFV